MLAITASNRGALPRCPAVTTGGDDICPCSQAQEHRGRRPVAGAAQRVIGQLGDHPAGRLAPQHTVPPGPGGVPMDPHDDRIDAHLPVDQPGRIGPGPRGGQDARPDACASPAPEHSP